MIGREGLDRSVLLDLAREAGCRDARSYLATGNLTFATTSTDPDRVAEALEERIEKVLGRRELVAVRTLSWLHDLVAEDRFSTYDPSEWELEVGLLRHDAPRLDPARVPDPRRTCLVETRAREVLTARPRAGGTRPHVNRLLERATGLPSTARGWSTLVRIADHTRPPPEG